MDELLKTSYERLANLIKQYNPECDFELIKKGFDLSVKAHQGQFRKSGEPYITHPIEVACILAEMELDQDAIVAGLLHDTVEDTIYTIDDITNLFGDHVALLVDGVTKLSQIPYSSKEELQIESFRKMFLAMAKDIRVILIKLADRLHNMRTLKSMSEEKQRRISRETMEIYAPLAHRLGMQKIKWELEDLALRYLDPIAYHEIADKIALKRIEREEYLENVKNILKEKLSEFKIDAHIEGRAKHFYSIYRKMYTNNIDVDEMYDLLAVRIIVKTIHECYEVLGIVHELFKPIPGRFKDYIAMPKKNMYQSLHTSLIGPGGRPFEIQIRTWNMHRIAEVGIAAHWKYKEGVSGASSIDSKLEWVRQLIDVHKDMNDTEELMHTLKIDLFGDEVFVFSPKGDVVNLPANATPIDFAYTIHSAIGNKTVGAKLNGKIVTLDTPLKNGDIVEIITSASTHGPSRDWLKIVKTNQAKKKINEWFKKEDRDLNIAQGKENLEKELKRNSIPVSILKEKEVMLPIYNRYNFNNSDDFYSNLGYGAIPYLKIVTRLKEEYKKRGIVNTPEVTAIDAKQHEKSSNSSGIIVKGIDNCLVHLSRCCNPVPGDDIVGYVTRGRGVSVHRKDCINAINIAGKDTELSERFIDVSWAKNQSTSYTTNLQVVANNRPGIIADITSALTNLKLNIIGLNARITKDNLAIVHISVEIVNTTALQKLIKVCKNLDGVTSVVRTKQ